MQPYEGIYSNDPALDALIEEDMARSDYLAELRASSGADEAGDPGEDYSWLEVVEDREVLQRADAQGPVIGRVQVILNKRSGERTEARFWYVNGIIHHVDSVVLAVPAEEVK